MEKNNNELKEGNFFFKVGSSPGESSYSQRKVSFVDVVEERMRREKNEKEPKLKTVAKKEQRLLLKPFEYDANLS